MARTWRVEVIANDGEPRVVKRADNDAGIEVLAAETDRLVRAAHPGVVAVIAHEPGRLELRWAGDSTLASRALPLPVAAAVLAAVAATVADLHAIGVVHGRLDPSHVVIDADGHPRLCGFRPADDAAPEPGPADDVSAVGQLIHHLVGPDVELEPIPEQRWRRRRWSGYQRRALQMLADQASHDDPAQRPTARLLASSIAECVPDARFAPIPPTPLPETPDAPGTGTSEADQTGETHQTDQTGASTWAELISHRESQPVGQRAEPGSDGRGPTTSDTSNLDTHLDADSGTSVKGEPQEAEPLPRILGLPVLPRSSPSPGPPVERLRPDPARRRTAHEAMPPDRWGRFARQSSVAVLIMVALVVGGNRARSGDTAPPHTTTPATTTPDTTSPATQTPDHAPTNPSGPPAVEHDGATYLIGVPGDIATVADWDCDGEPTVGLVRPSTGEVFLFDDWASPGQDTAVPAVAVVAGAATLVPDPSVNTSAGCSPPVVQLADGTTHPLTTGAQP